MFTGLFTPTQFAQKAKAAGYGWAAMEWNDFGNAARAPQVKAACEAQGLIFTIWMTRDFVAADVRKAAIESGCSGIILEGEIPAENAPGVPNPQAVDWASVAAAISDLPIPKAVVTNFAPFVHHAGAPWPEKANPLIDAGWACMTECYLSESPDSTPENTNYFATVNLGWKETQPVLGCYGGKTLADYPTRNNYRNWSVWAAGNVL